MVYHVINRSNGKLKLFKKEGDFLTFEQAVLQAHRKHPLPILGWCVLDDHWHFVVRPRREGDLSSFFAHLTLLHASRWQVAHDAIGSGHVYRGRFKNFMIQPDAHLLSVMKYVEQSPVREGMVSRVQDWRWSSLHVRREGSPEMKELLTDWPIERPRNWLTDLNRTQSDVEVKAVEHSLQRSSPLGDERWVLAMAKRHNLLSTLRPRGRPVGWRKA